MAAGTETKTFTLEEANQRLPLVRVIVRDIVALYRDVHNRRRLLEQLRMQAAHDSRTAGVAGERMEQDLDADISRLDDFVEELEELGVELKDPVTGLVGFPATIDGKPAEWSWRPDEEFIAFWQPADGGLLDRRSVLAAATDNA